MKTTPKKRKQLFEDLYDLLIESQWKDESRIELRKFIKDKNVSWDGDNNIISLGKNFRIKLLDN